MPKEDMLIKKVAEKDDDALEQLIENYRPMIGSLKKTYYLRDFDSQDWDQEARIVCYESACEYTQDKGKFSVYFRSRLKNRIVTLIRYYMANRRQDYLYSTSLDVIQNKERSYKPLNDVEHLIIEDSIREVSTDFLENLSEMELVSLLIMIGSVSEEEAFERWKINPSMHRRAKNRMTEKLKRVLFE
ncbi:MAG: sigma-70 family RNA polymerase sigma factor [Lactobacillus sp.]|nr:sigma-70 family RNA polymerase sigma factor [Lactobacillus sp.]